MSEINIGRKYYRYHARKKIIFIILSILTSAVTVTLTKRIITPYIKNPASVLKYPMLWFIIISIVIFAIWAGIVVKIVSFEARVMKKEERSAKVIGLGMIINIAVLSYMLYMLVSVTAGFSDRIGTIKIDDAQGLLRIKNYPGGTYELSGDIDMEGEEWKSISEFSGKLNGNGYAVTNIKIGKDGMFGKNTGEISNLSLSAVEYSDFDRKDGFGTLVMENRGKILKCSLITEGESIYDGPEGIIVGYNYGTCEEVTGKYTDKHAHDYKSVYTKKATLFKYGTKKYICASCGESYVSAVVYGRTIKLIFTGLLACTVLFIRFFPDAYRRRGNRAGSSYEKSPGKGTALLALIISLLLGFSFFVYENILTDRGNGPTVIDKLLPDDMKLSQEAYAEKQIGSIREQENNDFITVPTEAEAFSTVTGNLSGSTDRDYYRFALDAKSKIKFLFSHNGGDIKAWQVRFFMANSESNPEKEQILKSEALVPTEKENEYEINWPNVSEAGRYYLFVLPNNDTGVFSDAEYSITILPTCVEHKNKTIYTESEATCTKTGEITVACDDCGKVISEQKTEKTQHVVNEPEKVKKAMAGLLLKKSVTCSVCEKVETKTSLSHIWGGFFAAVIFIILSLSIFFGIVYKGGSRGNNGAVRAAISGAVAAGLTLCAAFGAYKLINTPFGGQEIVKNLIVAAFCIIHIVMLKNVLMKGFEPWVTGLCLGIVTLAMFLMKTFFFADGGYALALVIIFAAEVIIMIYGFSGSDRDDAGAPAIITFAVIFAIYCAIACAGYMKNAADAANPHPETESTTEAASQ